MDLNEDRIDPLTADVLPDSRATFISTPKHVVFELGMFWVPIYCGSCGKEGGRVPEENCTWAFWLCAICEVKYGDVAGVMMVPDSVYWERLKQEQLAHGEKRLLTNEELLTIVEADATPLSKLIKEGRSTDS